MIKWVLSNKSLLSDSMSNNFRIMMLRLYIMEAPGKGVYTLLLCLQKKD
jgi:hypothetical protein